MCILSYLPPQTPVDVDGLFNGGLHNPHGHGWAIVADDRIIVGKSLDLTEALEAFTTAREHHPGGPALFHSRWATHGSVTVDNVHPFVVGGSKSTVVAHNGILPSDAHPAKGDDRSDTRKFADEILPTRFRRLDRDRARDALSQWCGRSNKLAILTVDERYRCSAYLVNEAAGRWDDQTGIWHSNGDYLSAGVGGAAVGVWEYEERCELCWWGAFDANGYCEQCRSCVDCSEHVRDCMCWCRESVVDRRALVR